MYDYVDILNKVSLYYEKKKVYKFKGVIGRALWIIGFQSIELKSFFHLIKNNKNNNLLSFSFCNEEEVLIAKAILIILKFKNKNEINIKLKKNFICSLKKKILIYKLYLLQLNYRYNRKIKKKKNVNLLFFWDKYKYIDIYNELKLNLKNKLKIFPFMNNFNIENYIEDCIPQNYEFDIFNKSGAKNKFDLIYKILKKTLIETKPKKILYVEGDSPIHSLLVEVCKELKIKSLCLQWGSVIWEKPRYGFRDLNCDEFLSHGKFFVNQVKKFNKKTKFYVVGNPLLKIQKKNSFKKNKAIFLLQPSHTDPKKEFLKLMEIIIKKNRKWFFLIRKHPNQDNINLIEKYKSFKNVRIVNPKNETLCQSLEGISVSISSYSSSIVDGFIYDIVPLVFNTSKLLKTYNPNINKLELGIETKNFFYAQNEFGKVFENVNKIKLFKKNIKEKKFFFIKYIGNKAQKKLLKTILK